MTKRVATAAKSKDAALKGGDSLNPRSRRGGDLTMEFSLARRMPAEWETHAATWIAWPHHEPDWPGKLAPIPWVYAEIVRALTQYERVEILCHNETVAENARLLLSAHSVSGDKYRLHMAENDRVWLRDSAPTGVIRSDNKVELIDWGFNAWAKYDNYSKDADIGRVIERITGLPRTEARREDNGQRLILEGGGIEVNGNGMMLVTEEWLLTNVQVRNPGMSAQDYEEAFAKYLGVTDTIWLGEGAVGDDTHGHIDDIARFASQDTVILAYESDPADENHDEIDGRTLARLLLATQPLPLTFHRAFDRCANLPQALDELTGIGVNRVLTSGGARTAAEGAGNLAQMVQRSRGRIAILAGGKIRADNVAELVSNTGVSEVHSRYLDERGMGGLIGLVCGLIVSRVGRWWARPRDLIPEGLAAEYRMPMAVWSGVFGGLFHSLLDGIMHADVRPLRPFSDANPLYGLTSDAVLYLFCTITGLVGAALLLAWERRARRF